jgi:hypothetical protein
MTAFMEQRIAPRCDDAGPEMAGRQPPTIDRKMDGRGSDTVVSKPPEPSSGKPAMEETP